MLRTIGPASDTRARLPRPVWLLGWVSLVTDTATEMVYPLLPLFLTRVLGAGAMSLGVIEGVAEAANSVLKIVAGRLSDRTGAPKPIVIAGYTISGSVRPLIGLVTSWTHVLAIRFADRLGKGIRSAPRDAMLAHFAPREIRGRVFGFHRAMDNTGAVVGPLLASAFLFFFPEQYRTLFALTIIPGIVVVIILLRVPDARVEATNPPSPNPEPREHPEPAEPPEPPQSSGSAPRAPLGRALLVIFVFSVGNASDAFLLLRLSDVGIAVFWIPLLWSGLHVVKAVSSFVGGDLSDRYGRRALIGLGWLIYAAVYLGFGIVDSAAGLIAIFLIYGLYFGLTEGVEKAWIADLAPAQARGGAFGYYNATLGAGALAASLLFGLIWTRVSAHAAFMTGGAIALAATALLYLLFSHEADSRHQR